MAVQLLHTLLGLASFGHLVLGTFVLFKKRNDKLTLLLFLLGLSYFFWGLTILMLLKTSAFIYDYLTMISSILVICFMGLFIVSITKLSKTENFLCHFYFVFFSVVFVLALNIKDLFIIPGMVISNHLLFTFDPNGPLQVVFSLYGSLSLLIYFALLTKRLKQSKKTQKKKALLILVACVVPSLVAMTANLFLPTFGFPIFGEIGPISSLIFTIVVTYSIFKNDIFNIKIIFAEIVTLLFPAYMGALVFLSSSLGDLVFRLISFLITLSLSIVLLRAINNEVRLRAEIERTYQNQSNFLADIAHKFKTPLAIAKSNADMAKLHFSEKEYPEAEQTIIETGHSIKRLARLCSNLITLGKIDFGITGTDLKTINLSQVIKNAVQDFQPLAGDRHLEADIEPNILMAGDPNRLQEMLYNLLDNAVKFTDPEKGKILVTLRKHDNQIELSVRDNGSGIKEEDLPKLFDRYYQSEVRSGSAGIGLTIVKWIVERHHGEVKVESKRGRGTKILITF